MAPDGAEAALSARPLTADLWDDFEDLFGPDRGASSGCWCMWWRLTAKQFENGSREDRKVAFRKIVGTGPAPGLLLYEDDLAIGWVAVGPRASLPRMERSRVAKSTDGDLDGTWLVNCFFLRRGYRGKGHMSRLAGAATEHARAAGAVRVEACPVDPARELQWGEGFVGIASVFEGLGFSEVARRSPTRPLMRMELG